MSRIWLVLALTAAATSILKGTGPALLGGRAMPRRLLRVMTLLAPALLTALIATEVATSGHRLVIDERALGLAVAAIAIWRRAPVLVVIILAAVTTAVARAVF